MSDLYSTPDADKTLEPMCGIANAPAFSILTTGAEMDELATARHRVFVEELAASSPNPSGRMQDAFDASDAVANVVVRWRGRIAGGARFALDGPLGLTTDRFFDFRSRIPQGSRLAAGSMLWLAPELRGRGDGIMFGLLDLGRKWCHDREATHLVCVANPPLVRRFERAGYRLIAAPFDHPCGLPIAPMLQELRPFPSLTKRPAAPLGCSSRTPW